MNYLYTTAIALVLTIGSISAQNSVTLDIDHRLGGEEFAFFQETDQSGYVFDLYRLEYYISDISIVHDGGMTTDINNIWHLVNSDESGQFNLGNRNIEVVESIRFYIGVGPDVNNDDPASWPPNHPLYPQNPSMHWGWTSGYRFVAIEGYAGPASASNLFQIHALGNENYFQATVDVTASAVDGNITIPLVAEYANALNGIDVSTGVINHATTGISVPLLQNFSTEVFSPGVITSIEENEFAGDLTISPNPSEGPAMLTIDLPEGGNYSLQIIDMNGRSVQQVALTSYSGAIDLPELTSGVYIIELMDNATPLTTRRWVVK